ncbi:carotenoid biosynthesis protein [Gemmatimonas sp.]|uniref:carotenoid biosynthesis protein n=1 Tax=Gemmatimonas sp. TaxID=1962908 RepID=UPI003982FF8B
MTATTDLRDTLRDTSPSTLLKIAGLTLLGHAFFSAFSAFAFATFLVPPYPEWLQTAQNQKVMAVGFAYGGATTVTLGALAGLAFLAHCIGHRRAMLVFVVSFGLAFISEYAGTVTDYPFGAYEYTSQLGYKLFGRVPFNIPTSWFYMLVASLAICGRFLPAKDDNTSKWYWALMGGLVLTAWDVSMDPAMVKTNHWFWQIGTLADRSAFEQFIGRPIFFGMPITNWLGWLFTGILVARVMLAIVPPTMWAAKVSPSRLPITLYAVNGLLPLAICFRQDMVLAGVLGTIAMAIPLWAALRNEPQPLGTAGTAPMPRVAVSGR